MNAFLILASITLFFTIAALGCLGFINFLRGRQPGCSGSHDCVIYKGEKVMCPSCELREMKAQVNGS